MNFDRPGRFHVGVDLSIEALNQLAGQSRPLFCRELQCRIQ
jgi:hypothetical protein